ncbi:hypothetical protein TRICI_004597 [Trichomonascus ciferrii]|uniref:Uncharacterized protein n=1 Tax=Trichomonascus ciferrii TaxID=44093 RepID=A0A642V068_9ASCO|nr:hypothetical protein TRICI_004597 [Trichomonascus ciferrii]
MNDPLGTGGFSTTEGSTRYQALFDLLIEDCLFRTTDRGVHKQLAFPCESGHKMLKRLESEFFVKTWGSVLGLVIRGWGPQRPDETALDYTDRMHECSDALQRYRLSQDQLWALLALHGPNNDDLKMALFHRPLDEVQDVHSLKCMGLTAC